jgi:outer membrane murein-binding lipoprotein Lpp
VKKAEKIANDQRGIAEGLDKLGKGGASAGETERLSERAAGLESDVRQLESQLDRMRRDAQKDRKDAATKLGEAVQSMRENRLADKVQATPRIARALAQGRTSPEYVNSSRADVTGNVEEMRQKVNEAAVPRVVRVMARPPASHSIVRAISCAARSR